MDLQSGKQYLQSEISPELFNISNGSTVNYGGKAYTGTVNGNGTRSFSLAGGGGGNYDDLLKNTPKAGDFADTLNAGVNDSFGKYLDHVKTSPTSLDFYTKNLNAAGIPGLQKTQSTLQGQIYNLEDTLRRVEGNVAATTGNSIVTQGQRSGMIEARQKPLIENLGWIGQSLGRVSSAVQQGKSDVMNLTQLNSQDQGRVDDAYKMGISVQQENAARSMSGFTADRQSFLDVSLAKIRRGEQISDMEAQQAFEVLQSKRQFDNQVELLKKQGGGSDLMTLSEGQAVYDPATGQIKYKNDKTYKASGGTAEGGFSIGGGSARGSAGF